jgi:hypothetical protein
MSDQPVAEAATYTTNTRDEHPRPLRDSNRGPSNQPAADLPFRPRGHRDRLGIFLLVLSMSS